MKIREIISDLYTNPGRLNEIVFDVGKQTLDLLRDEKVTDMVHSMYADIKEKSKNFSMLPSDLYDAYVLTDVLHDTYRYKQLALATFPEKSQVIGVLDRIISYLEYDELSERLRGI